MNLTLEAYLNASDEQKQELIRHIERVRPDLQFDSFLSDGPYPLPRFFFKRLRTYFIYIPGGTFNMGMSEAEEWAAREIADYPGMNFSEMRPVTEVTVAAFLAAETPFTQGQGFRMQAYVKMWETETHIENLTHSAEYKLYTCFETAQALAEALNMQLPTEIQREYFARGNTQTLFCFGDRFPPTTELVTYLIHEDAAKLKRNNFGMAGLFITEWTTDLFRYNYASDKVARKTRVLRGGGGDFYYWGSWWEIKTDWSPLDEKDWIWFASAMRMPSTYLVDDMAGFRLIINLDQA